MTDISKKTGLFSLPLSFCFFISVKSHAVARRHKLHFAVGCGKPRRLLIPCFLSVISSGIKNKAAVKILRFAAACLIVI